MLSAFNARQTGFANANGDQDLNKKIESGDLKTEAAL
jgi:hypothetical protein